MEQKTNERLGILLGTKKIERRQKGVSNSYFGIIAIWYSVATAARGRILRWKWKYYLAVLQIGVFAF